VGAHRSAAGGKGGEWTQAVGRSRGGRTSKIHCLADHRGRPLAFALTPGNVADITIALPLLQSVAQSRRLIADKAYDADSLLRWLQDRRIKAVVPSTTTRTVSYPLDHRAYKRRDVIKRLFCRLKTGKAGHALRSPRPELSRQPGPHRCRRRVDPNESPT
jgi:transposase